MKSGIKNLKGPDNIISIKILNRKCKILKLFIKIFLIFLNHLIKKKFMTDEEIKKIVKENEENITIIENLRWEVRLLAKGSSTNEKKHFLENISHGNKKYLMIILIIATILIIIKFQLVIRGLSEFLNIVIGVVGLRILLGLFILFLVYYLYLSIKKSIISKICNDIVCDNLLCTFLNRLSEFRESDVINFIENHYRNRMKCRYLLLNKLFGTFSNYNVEVYKNLFILALEKSGAVALTGNIGPQRIFIIITSLNYPEKGK